MKKLLCILTLCLLLIAILSGCSDIREIWDILQNLDASTPSESSTPTAPPHVCQAGDTLSMNRVSHYYTCTCGQMMNEEDHNLVDQTCTICSAKLSAEEIQGLHYLWLSDEKENVIRTQAYYVHELLRTYTFEYTYGEDGKILGKKSYADGVIYDSSTWDADGNVLTEDEYDTEGTLTKAYRHERAFDDNDLLLTMRTYCNDILVYEYTMTPESLTATENKYRENGSALSTTQYTYDRSGVLTQELRYQYGVLAHKLEYAVQNGTVYPQKEYIYDADGNYTFQLYDLKGELLAKQHLDTNGNPVDFFHRFNADACADLVGTWSGEVTLDSSMVDAELPNFQLNARLYMTLDQSGVMTVVYTMDNEELRQTLISATMEALRDQFGRERSQEELDIIFKAEYRKSMQKYVEDQVDKTDMSKMLYNKSRYVYFVEDNLLYSGDRWNTIPEASLFTRQGDQLIFQDLDSGLSISLTRGGTEPLPPRADIEPDYQYDSASCTPLLGTWEFTYTQNSRTVEGISIRTTIRLTFQENGIVIIEEFYDPEDYYDYMLAHYIEDVYRRWDPHPREQVDGIYANKGTTVAAYAEANMPPLGELLPGPRYAQYYIDNEGYLILDYTMTHFTVTDTVLTFLRYISATENEEFPFTKID